MPDKIAMPLKCFIAFTVLPVAILVLSGCSRPLTGPPESTGIHIPANDSEVPRISPEDLKQRMDSGEEILIADARSVNSFRAQHIPGAISVPLKEIARRLDEFPKEKPIVFY